VPEGDTIHRLARRLGAALDGRTLVRVEVPRRTPGGPPPPAPGTRVEAVEAKGKHLLIRFGDGTTLRTHLRMNGSWRCYAPGEPWRHPRHRMRALVAVEADEADDGPGRPALEAVCFDAPVVVLERSPAIQHLGPDLCRADVDLDAAVARIDALAAPKAPLVDVLLDQRIACGVGNIYKSEVCFAVGRHPLTPISALDATARRELLAVAARLLQANLGDGPRTTANLASGRQANLASGRRAGGAPGGLAVYGRARQRCRRCGAPIRVARLGTPARTTYWCQSCQLDPSSPG
jgi:endonuclease-8